MVERNENPKAVDMRIFDDEESHNDEDEEDASSKAPGDVEERESEGGRYKDVEDVEEEKSDDDEDDNEDEAGASSKAPCDVEERESEGGRHGEVAEHTEGDVHLLAEVVVIM